MASKASEMKSIIQWVESHGFKLVRHEKHYIFRKDALTLTVSGTPGDEHRVHNIKRNFRHMGIDPLPFN